MLDDGDNWGRTAIFRLAIGSGAAAAQGAEDILFPMTYPHLDCLGGEILLNNAAVVTIAPAYISKT